MTKLVSQSVHTNGKERRGRHSISLACSDSTVATAPSPLEELLSKTPTSFLQPYCFFVSWQGVLTLAFRCPIPLESSSMPHGSTSGAV
jgi:hypothetical protein